MHWPSLMKLVLFVIFTWNNYESIVKLVSINHCQSATIFIHCSLVIIVVSTLIVIQLILHCSLDPLWTDARLKCWVAANRTWSRVFATKTWSWSLSLNYFLILKYLKHPCHQQQPSTMSSISTRAMSTASMIGAIIEVNTEDEVDDDCSIPEDLPPATASPSAPLPPPVLELTTISLWRMTPSPISVKFVKVVLTSSPNSTFLPP